MAKQINVSNLKPVFTILEIAKKQELSKINAGDLLPRLQAIEAENLKVLENKAFKKAFEDAKEKVAKANEILALHEIEIGEALFYRMSTPNLPGKIANTQVKTGPNKYDYAYLAITRKQLEQATQELEDLKDSIELKYETIKAQIMLASDYAQIRDVLSAYNINLDAPVDIAEKA